MYKMPNFPDDIPEEVKKEILEKLDTVDRFSEDWKPRLRTLSDLEFAGLFLAVKQEKDTREEEMFIRMAASDPKVRAAVLGENAPDDEAPSIGDFNIEDIIGGLPN